MSIESTFRNIMSELGDRHFQHMLFLPFTLPFAVRRFLHERLSLVSAGSRLKSELENRELRFLELIRARVYAVPGSPYKKLLDYAGCELGDIESCLNKTGLEETLKELARSGVYLTPREYKGRQDVERGRLSFRVYTKDLVPPRRYGAAAGVNQSSGTTNKPRSSVSSFDWWREESPAMALFLDAHGLLSSRMAAYEPMLGSLAAGITFFLMTARLGVPVDRWFARPVPVNNWLEDLYFRLTSHEIALAGQWFGPGFARPEVTPAGDIDRIVRWVERGRKEGFTTCIRTVASNAARIAQVADEIGASLEGCTFIASGEPVTKAKRCVIEKVGGTVTVLWGYWPTGTVGVGCGRPAYGDEMHVMRHSLAVIEHPEPITDAIGEPVHPLLFTTLYPSAAQLEINVANGDHAVLSERNCGCPMHEAGLTLHAHHVGSFEKFTSEGLAFPFDDLYELLDTTLPDKFGGGVGDYQLVEEEGMSGRTHVTLLVDPSVGPIRESSLLDFLTAEFAAGSRSKGFMAGVWRDSGTFRIRRESPTATSRGKVLPLRVAAKVR